MAATPPIPSIATRHVRPGPAPAFAAALAEALRVVAAVPADPDHELRRCLEVAGGGPGAVAA